MLLFPSSRLGTKTCHSVSLDQMGQISGSDTGSSHVGFWDMPHIREKYIYIYYQQVGFTLANVVKLYCLMHVNTQKCSLLHCVQRHHGNWTAFIYSCLSLPITQSTL